MKKIKFILPILAICAVAAGIFFALKAAYIIPPADSMEKNGTVTEARPFDNGVTTGVTIRFAADDGYLYEVPLIDTRPVPIRRQGEGRIDSREIKAGDQVKVLCSRTVQYNEMNTRVDSILFPYKVTILTNREEAPKEKVALKPHFTANDTTYWSAGGPLMPGMLDGFAPAGTIQSETSEHTEENWQSNGFAVGTEIWLNPDVPYQAFVGGDHLCLTEEAGRRYLLHDGDLYVYLGSIQSYDGAYYAQYRDSHDLTIPKENLPIDAVELGTTTFGMYYRYPTNELESNFLTEPHTVYQDNSDPNVLYALSEGGTASVYIKYPD